MAGYVALTGPLGTDFFGEMAWEQNVYENGQMFGAVSYQVGEVDESDNLIHEDEGEDEGLSSEPAPLPEAAAADADDPERAATPERAAANRQTTAVIGNTVKTDASTLVGDDTVVVAEPTSSDTPIVPNVPHEADADAPEGGSAAVVPGSSGSDAQGASGGEGEGESSGGGASGGENSPDPNGGGDSGSGGSTPPSDDPSDDPGTGSSEEPSDPGSPSVPSGGSSDTSEGDAPSGDAGEGDDPSGPGEEDDPSGPGESDAPGGDEPGSGGLGEGDASDVPDAGEGGDPDQAEDNRPPCKDPEGNTLVDIEVEVPSNWTFVSGEAFHPSDVHVMAIFEAPDGTPLKPREIFYDGDDPYKVSISTKWTSGTHYATFTYGDQVESKPFVILRGYVHVRYGTSDDGTLNPPYRPVEYPSRFLPEDMQKAVASSSEDPILRMGIGGAFVDLTEAHRRMITILGMGSVAEAFKNAPNDTDKTYHNVWVLEPLDAGANKYLKKMVTGFRMVSGNQLEEGVECVYLPELYAEAGKTKIVVDMVDDVPAGCLIRRVAGDASVSYCGDQVFVGYENQADDGAEVEVSVPCGVTKVSLEKVNKNVTSLVIPESVLEIDFKSVTRCFPNLKCIKVGDGNSQTYRSHGGALYSADGLRMLYVPPKHESFDKGTDSWLPGVEVIGKEAFAGCSGDGEGDKFVVVVPSHIKRLEEGCFADARIIELCFESESPVEGAAVSGASGSIYVPDSAYDVACKRWVVALGDAGSDLLVGVLGDAGGEVVAPGAYALDSSGCVVVRAAEPQVLASVRSDVPGACIVPEGVEEVDPGAFTASAKLKEIVLPATLKHLGAESLVGLGNVASVTLSSAEVVTVDAHAFGEDGLPGTIFYVPSVLYGEYLTTWSAALDLDEDAAKELIKPSDVMYRYIGSAKYQVLDEAEQKLLLVEVYDEGQTFFEPEAGTVEIADGAFSDCASLEIVHVPASVSKVGKSVFAGCGRLESVLVSGVLSEAFDVGDAMLYQSGAEVSYDCDTQIGAIYAKGSDNELTLVNVPTDAASLTVRQGTTHLGDNALRGFLNSGGVFGFESPETLVSIGAHCFEGSSISEADFAQFALLETVGAYAFADCAELRSVSLPDSTVVVGESAFADCAALRDFAADGLVELAPRTFQRCTALAALSTPNVTVVGDECFYACAQLIYVDPGSNVGELTWVGDRAFSGCVVFCQNAKQTFDMKSLRHIGAGAFEKCNGLKTVTLPKSLTDLGENAFCDCSSLTSLRMESSVATIGRYSFYGCVSLTSLEIDKHQQQLLEVMGACSFEDCDALERVDLSGCSRLTLVGDRAFRGCDTLLRVTMPSNLAKVSDECFESCPLLSIVELPSEEPAPLGETVFGEIIPEYVRIWVRDQQAYEKYLSAYEPVLDPVYGEGCALRALEVRSETSETLRGITYEMTDKGWVVTDALPNLHGTVSIDSSVVGIGDGAFTGCAGIESVTFEEGTSLALGDQAFANCSSIQTVSINGNIPTWGEGVFEGCTSLSKVSLGNSTNDVIPRIGTRAFAGCTSLVEAQFYAQTATIGAEAFAGCSSLPTVTSVRMTIDGKQAYILQMHLESIEDGAFRDCTRLRSVPYTSKFDKIINLGAYAFYNCDSLKTPMVPKNATSVGKACFAECDSVTQVSIYSALEEYPEDCFKNCPNLTRTGGTTAALTALKRIGKGAYAGCTSLTANESWTPGKYENLESIGDGAFAGAFANEADAGSFALASSLTYIGANAFDGCVGLASIELQSAPTLGVNAFANMAEGFRLKVSDGTYDAYLPVLAASIGEEAAKGMLFDEAAAAAAEAAAEEAEEAAADAASKVAEVAADADSAARAKDAPAEGVASASAEDVESAAGANAEGSEGASGAGGSEDAAAANAAAEGAADAMGTSSVAAADGAEPAADASAASAVNEEGAPAESAVSAEGAPAESAVPAEESPAENVASTSASAEGAASTGAGDAEGVEAPPAAEPAPGEPAASPAAEPVPADSAAPPAAAPDDSASDAAAGSSPEPAAADPAPEPAAATNSDLAPVAAEASSSATRSAEPTEGETA
ncbi:leucine-rich repeat domain-containing protein [Adlercreutzia sp. ZJ473]|uniref:leucine-rich repeat domain-containing protein n=1 Tax=Adlercreutzia sp. ZJ473 TaxID=2722822 RepID=UPI0015536497|nr:leucine-rich repeat domain-containing protein [Adlercreutzia sp. ZJ473]